jgi:hypothetical protein
MYTLCYTIVFCAVVAVRATAEVFFAELPGFFLCSEKVYTHITLAVATFVFGALDSVQATNLNLCHLVLLSNYCILSINDRGFLVNQNVL